MAGSKEQLLFVLASANMDLGALLGMSDELQVACLACADDDVRVQDPVLLSFQQGVITVLEDESTPASYHAALILTWMGLTAAQHGRITAFQLGLDASLLPKTQNADTRLLSLLMQKAGWYKTITEDHIRAIGKRYAMSQQDNEDWASHGANKIFDYLGFGTIRDLAWLKPILDFIALPWLDQALAKDFKSTALVLDRRLYTGWVNAYEIMDHYNEGLNLWTEKTGKAGRDFARDLPTIPRPVRTRPLIGIFIYNSAWLAHVDLLYQTLRWVPERDYDICLYFLYQKDVDTAQKFAGIGIDSWFLSEKTDSADYSERARILREKAVEDGVAVAIWLCLPISMEFYFGMKLAPHQIYWSMKHPVDSFRMPDDYWASINTSGDIAKFYELSWKSLPVTYAKHDAPDMEKVAKIRSAFPEGTVLLGTIAREEKLNSPDFLSAVCDILKAHPNTIYMHTGKRELPSIKAIFEKEGVFGQTRFIGWVDARLYAEVFDIYIDCWPARSGMTAYAALEAEKPLVINVAPNANHDFVRLFYFYFQLVSGKDGYHLPDPALDADFTLPDGSRALLACESRSDYVAAVGRLIDDPVWRKACGKAGRALSAWLNDSARAGQKVDNLFREAIQKALS